MHHLSRLFVAPFIILTLSATASALDFTSSEAGSLADNITLPSSETTLKINGPINAADLYFIADNIPSLTTLDLSQAQILACQTTVAGKQRTFDDGVIPEHIFAGSKLSSLTLPRLYPVIIGELAFAGSHIKEITIPQNVTAIGIGAFSSCPELRQAQFSGKTNFESHVFANSTSLYHVIMADVDSIAPSTFSACTSLTSVEGLDKIKKIGDSAFTSCTDLNEFSFSSTLTSIGNSAFAYTPISTLNLSQCVILNHIGDWAFAHCKNLDSVTLPDEIKTLGEGVFFDCNNVTSIHLPKKLQQIGNYALKGNDISHLTLPADLNQIGDLAMSGTDNLAEIDASDIHTVPTLGADVWDTLEKNNVTLHVPAELSAQFLLTPQWQDFAIVSNETNLKEEIANPTDLKISACFEGNTLVIKSNHTLASIKIYTVNGRLTLTQRVITDTARIDTSALTGPLFIVEATTADSHRGVLKISR